MVVAGNLRDGMHHILGAVVRQKVSDVCVPSLGHCYWLVNGRNFSDLYPDRVCLQNLECRGNI